MVFQMITMVDFTEAHIEQAARLAQAEYDAERAQVPALPQARVPDLQDLARSGFGVAAFDGGQMVGYLCACEPFKNAFGTTKVKGVWSPIHAHAAVGDKAQVYHRMYQAAARKWVDAGALSHAVTLYAHDDDANRAWFTYGFGLRCVDAVKPLDSGAAVPDGDFLELPRERAGELTHLGVILERHLEESPCFLAYRYRHRHPRLTEKEMVQARIRRNSRMFAARQGGKFAAYLEVREKGENFACDAADMMSICGAVAVPEVRGTGLFANLLRYAESVLAGEGYARLGVDFESFNPTALGFWTKHFTAYTHSVVRRIDERGHK